MRTAETVLLCGAVKVEPGAGKQFVLLSKSCLDQIALGLHVDRPHVRHERGVQIVAHLQREVHVFASDAGCAARRDWREHTTPPRPRGQTVSASVAARRALGVLMRPSEQLAQKSAGSEHAIRIENRFPGDCLPEIVTV